MPQESFRIRQIHNHHKENDFALKIRGLRSQDFGEYECNVYSNRTRTQRSAALNVTGNKQYHQSKLVTYMFGKLKRYKGNHCTLRIDLAPSCQNALKSDIQSQFFHCQESSEPFCIFLRIYEISFFMYLMTFFDYFNLKNTLAIDRNKMICELAQPFEIFFFVNT